MTTGAELTVAVDLKLCRLAFPCKQAVIVMNILSQCFIKELFVSDPHDRTYLIMVEVCLSEQTVEVALILLRTRQGQNPGGGHHISVKAAELLRDCHESRTEAQGKQYEHEHEHEREHEREHESEHEQQSEPDSRACLPFSNWSCVYLDFVRLHLVDCFRQFDKME